MTEDSTHGNESGESSASFSEQAGEKSPGLVKEFAAFLGENKKWWLLPIIVVLGLVSLLVVLAPTGVLPFIYTLF